MAHGVEIDLITSHISEVKKSRLSKAEPKLLRGNEFMRGPRALWFLECFLYVMIAAFSYAHTLHSYIAFCLFISLSYK